VLDLDSVVLRQEGAVLGYETLYSLEEEVRRMEDFDLITVVGPTDLARVRSVSPELQVIETPAFRPDKLPQMPPPAVTEQQEVPKILLTASNATFNQVSLVWFWTRAWPRIRQALPQTRLLIVGEIAQTALSIQAQSDPRVEIRGMINDLNPVLDSATVVLAPYYYGDGVKLKVLTALARGIPVVTTSLGTTNTRLKSSREVLIADAADSFADCVLSLLKSVTKRTAMGKAGLEFVRQHYAGDSAFRPYKRAVLQLLRSPKKKEASLFAGKKGSATWLLEGLRHLIPWAIYRCRQANAEKVAIYGAGSHTRILIPFWTQHRGPAIQTIVVTSSEHVEDSSLLGYPVCTLDEFDADSVDAIVMSSQSHELTMSRTCQERWPTLPRISIWAPPVIESGHKQGQSSEPMSIDTCAFPYCENELPERVLETLEPQACVGRSSTGRLQTDPAKGKRRAGSGI
jgi:hypothetical protein